MREEANADKLIMKINGEGRKKRERPKNRWLNTIQNNTRAGQKNKDYLDKEHLAKSLL